MKLLSSLALLCGALLLIVYPAFAQTTEHFDSRDAASLSKLTSFLQNHCWQFSGFDVNTNISPIEGDGTLTSETSVTGSQSSGIYTPVLNVGNTVKLSFTFKLDKDLVHRKWLKIFLTDGNNVLVRMLDSMPLNKENANVVYTYSKSLVASPGSFRIFINYQGAGGDERLSLDELNISATEHYAGGCNTAPTTVNDIYYGDNNHKATGNVIENDFDANHETSSAYLSAPSPDGEVHLLPDGKFSFTHNPGFTGASTNFTYRICDCGIPQLCSRATKVTLNFPSPQTPNGMMTIMDFSADYNKSVVLTWSTGGEANGDRFEIERSTDGQHFEVAGKIKAQGSSAPSHNYVFNDEVSEKIAKKKDLFYRLKKVDVDGKTSYSKILIVRVFKTKTLQTVSVTPNPSVNDIKVNLRLNENAYVVIKVTGDTGMELMRKSVKAPEGANSFVLEGSSGYQKGMYLIEVIVNSNERMLIKAIKS